MKKSLLFLGLLGYASSLHAQTTPNLGPWVQVNTVNSGAFAPGYRIDHVNTVSPNVAWAVAQEIGTTNSNAFFVTKNAAGTEFDFGSINAPNGSQTFVAGNISGISNQVAVAATYSATAGGGEILRTTNAGISWTKVSTANQFVASQGGFLNFIHMFDANVGVAMGDPTNGSFEILRTTNGGVTWTRNAASTMPTPLPNEYGLVHSFFASGNTIWFGGGSSVATSQVRIFKSTDRGATWTASTLTSLVSGVSKLAFRDAQNGIAYNVTLNAAQTEVTAVNVIRSADGGATWSSITPVNNATGSFFRFDIDAVDGKFYSVGARFPTATPAVAADFGSSYSTDGINWTNANNSQGFFAFDLIPGTVAGTAAGYAGAQTDANGVGGIFKSSNVIRLASRDAALQSGLNVFPNPSASGVFTVELGNATSLQAGAELTISDALGRQVKSQSLNATTIGARKLTLDLSAQKSGVYTLQIRTQAGLAIQKIVIE